MNSDPRNFSLNRRRMIGALAGGLSVPFVARARAQEKILYINTWGGPWEAAAKEFLFDPFTEQTGIQIRTVSPVSFAKLAAQTRTGIYEFDVTTLGVAELGRANQANLIEKIDAKVLDHNKLWPGAAMMNSVASHAFANLIAYRKDKFPNGGPQTWSEFWDAAKFPGPRSLQNYPARVLAFALLADGVAPDKLFPYDLDRAFRSLDRIKPHIRVWWNQGPQAQQLIRDGEVDAIGMWNTNARVLAGQNIPIEVIWNGAVLDIAVWVVARGTPRAQNAWKFIEFAVQAPNVAKFALKNNYGPMNPKAFEHLAESDAKQMPTWPDNFKQTIVLDPEKLLPQLDIMSKRFERWLAS
jgi:putative spermidine/putrescine transport system substrate-binding protein